ncbi:DUF1116 domain-containing protein [Saccharopolyspora shandongensis]|uniref:oxamate carbamoyltransferase subunit AllG family protein n=1 Tax=Saccharopolyspora shandongensis TaxID=418495 RepID=UPI00343F369E
MGALVFEGLAADLAEAELVAASGQIDFSPCHEHDCVGSMAGANDESVVERLIWMRDVLGPMLKEAMEIGGPVDLRLLLAQALHMGDEAHNRNNAGTLLLFQALSSPWSAAPSRRPSPTPATWARSPRPRTRT